MVEQHEISFGSEIVYAQKRMVTLDTSDETIEASYVRMEDDKEALGMSGTVFVSEIEAVVEIWSWKRVIDALNNYSPIPRNYLHTLELAAQKQPVKVTLSKT